MVSIRGLDATLLGIVVIVVFILLFFVIFFSIPGFPSAFGKRSGPGRHAAGYSGNCFARTGCSKAPAEWLPTVCVCVCVYVCVCVCEFA